MIYTSPTKRYADGHQKRGPRRQITQGKNKGKWIGGPTPGKRRFVAPQPSKHARKRKAKK
jgi:hypothetical protein